MTVYIDISNYVLTRAHTGIQRVVREFLFRLCNENHVLKYKVIFYDANDKTFKIIDFEELIQFLNDSKNYKFDNILNPLSIENMKENDIFFDIDGAWNNGLKRNYLYPLLRLKKLKIYNFIYDLVPIILPKYTHLDTVRNFTTYLYAVYKYSDLVFFDSRSAEKDFLDVKLNIGNFRNIATNVVKLGADISVSKNNPTKSIFQSKYILFVGTVEPRKGQLLLLEAFEKLSFKHNDINLVFVGKAGWNNDFVISRIENHLIPHERVFWLQDMDDDELVSLYKNAYINVYLSKYEGFGLPILESLAYGNVTITSKNSSMYEVGKNYADYVQYNSLNEITEVLDLYLSDEELYNKKKIFIQKNFKPYSWDITFNSIISVFENINKNLIINKPDKLQFVFISIDFDNLKGTIQEIDKYIDFVKEYIIVTRFDMIEDFKKIESNNKIIIIDENQILKEYSVDFKNRDHVSKNWLLRASLLNLDILDEQFIMLDDDNRPLKKIDIEHFIKNGKYNAYFFYDLLNWNNFQTDYDNGQHNMKNILDKDGLELLSYSSHKPQIIDKSIFKEVVDKYFDVGLTVSIDEWSIYFNYAVSNYSFLFNKIKYDTLNWPGHSSNWKQQYFQDEYNFENYYKTNYQGELKDKIKTKETEMNPYLSNMQNEINNNLLYQKYNMVHGVFEFQKLKEKINIFSFPYFLKAKQLSWVKLGLNYKAINCNDSNIQLMYYINGRKGALTKLNINSEYEDNVVEFGISCENLEIGEYNLLIDCIIDNENIYGLNSPYLVKLIIE